MGIISNLLFGDNTDKTTYKDAAQAKAYRDITEKTLDRAYEGSKDYLDNNYEGGYNKYKSDLMFGLQDQATDKLNKYNAGKNEMFGNGLIGSLLNPIAQTASGLGDLALLGISGGKYNAWDGSNNYLGTHRDIGSDLGALGETALTVAPIAKGLSLAKAGKAVQAGTATAKQMAKVAAAQAPKSLGKKIAGGALLGAGFGATGSLRDMGFENFDPQKFMLSTGIGAGLGGGMAGLGSLWNKYTTATVPVTTPGDATPYQEALNNLKNNAGGAMYSDTATNLPAVRGLDTARVTLDNLDNDTLKQLYRSGLKNARGASGANEATSAIKNSKNLLQDFLDKGIPTTTTYETRSAKGIGEALKNLKTNVGNTKAGTKISSLLKTKKGKVLAGAGGGLLLAQLLRNKGQNNNLSDEELNELYNYVYGGGQ